MKTNIMKKVIAMLLSASTVFSAACASSMVFAAEDGAERFITVESLGVGEYGYEGYRVVDENGNEVIDEPMLSTQSTADLPAAYDSRENGIITSVKDQGSSANCWAFAATSLMETGAVAEGIDTLETADYSEAHLVWFTHIRRVEDESDPTYGDGVNVTSDPYLTGGNAKKAAASLARWSGMADEESYPYNGYDLASMGNYSESERYTTDSGAILKSWEVLEGEAAVKQWIMENGAVSAAYYHHDAYLNTDNFAYYNPQDTSTNHAIVIVGWDDSYSSSNFDNTPEGDGAWLCKNSWGSDWGCGGYFWISYYDTSICNFDGYTAMAADDYYNNYTYNGSYWQSAYGISGATQCANVFVAEEYETLSAISTVTADPGINVKVTVYKNLPEDYTSPVEGTKAAYAEAYLDNEGYHTINLEEEIALEPGEIFSVVLEEYNENGITFVPIEKGENFTSKEKQSFINYRASRTNWKDTLDEGYGNLYIQAITKCAHHDCETVTVESTCAETGREKAVCTQCGEVVKEIILPVKQHVYGEWSEYVHTEDGNETSTRSCIGCGKVQTNSYSQGNVVSLSDFFEIFFARIFEMFSSAFTSNR